MSGVRLHHETAMFVHVRAIMESSLATAGRVGLQLSSSARPKFQKRGGIGIGLKIFAENRHGLFSAEKTKAAESTKSEQRPKEGTGAIAEWCIHFRQSVKKTRASAQGN
jgi:hypothetical protein